MALGTVVTTLLATKLGKLAVGLLGTGLIAKITPKLLHPLFKRLFSAGLAKLLNPSTKDPTERLLLQNVFLAVARLAEYKIPDRGQGAARKALITKWVLLVLPSSQAAAVSELIDEAAATLDDELKDVDHRKEQPPIPPASS